MSITKFFVVMKYRWDQGISFLTFVNFAFLAISISDKLQAFAKEYLHLSLTTTSVTIYTVILAFIGVWLFGYILDVFIKYPHHMATASNVRNPELQEILNNTRELMKK